MQSGQYKFSNHLVHESSPYLLQHAHNPVNWYPWGNEALEKAKKENKLVLISIGYAACHWCHVMERESFEDEEVARFMNEHFVAIKVDREERPDVDQVYMNAVQLITGSGGWPLNCIALPDGRPVYGGTYFPKAQWMDMLSHVYNFVKDNPEKAEMQAQSLAKGIKSSEEIYKKPVVNSYNLSELDKVFGNWENNIDFIRGGSLGAPKFPLPVGYEYLLFYTYLSGNKSAARAVNVSLHKMAEGGIYDQAGGGFSRYSTDADWKVPHFEKMLYDNAQLVSLYANAFQYFKDPLYKKVVEETLGFISRELKSPEGGFYSSLDADSEGSEGKFYTWKEDEIRSVCGEDAELVIEYFNVSGNGNWEENRNILYRSGNDEELAGKFNITVDELNEKLVAVKRSLMKARDPRIHPALDDKILTSWNALMLKAYADAYKITGNSEYLSTALINAEFINETLKSPDNKLFRNYKNGKASINGFLDDYAFTIDAFISLYQITFDEKWLMEAKNLSNYCLLHFYDESSGMFYYTSDEDPALIARKMEISDNVIPSSNSQMARNLFVLGQYFYLDSFLEISRQMLANVRENIIQAGPYYANWGILLALNVSAPFEVSIVGKDCISLKREFDSHYLPDVIYSGGENEGKIPSLKSRHVKAKTMIYVCRNKECKMPVTTSKEALMQLERN
ncbi:MAG: thioredoxin domain-containing protein [Bacteroidales bacterium]|nr:thioredoxin domain-containing protein [Bacteroidales bacterium]